MIAVQSLCVDDDVFHDAMKASQLKASAARRQVLVDTLKCCMVSDFVPNSENSEALYEFIHEVDTTRGSTCILSRSGLDDSKCTSKHVATRRDLPLAEAKWAPGSIDLSLGRYVDAFNAEEALSELHVLEDGSVLSSEWEKISRTLPWFDEFVETIEIRSVASFERIRKSVASNFTSLKSLYVRLARFACSLDTRKSVDKLAILNSNFPKGILGFRSLQNSQDPMFLKYILIKQTEANRRRDILFSGPRSKRYVEESVAEEEPVAELEPIGSKNAQIPDLKFAWGGVCQFVDRNRVIDDMRRCEAECMDAMVSWSIPECRQFLEKLAVHGKNFKKISQTIPEKTEKDCVDFYYRFKIHLELKAVIAAGSVSRQDRRKGGNEDLAATSNYKTLIDSIISSKINVSLLNNRALQQLNLIPPNDATVVVSKPVLVDESEHRNALIDIIAELIARGFPVPEELGIAEYVAATSSRVSLSVVKTEISVLEAAPRILQSHHTV